MLVQTEYKFSLPLGYNDGDKSYQDGVMSLATAEDEILALSDLRVKENEAFFPIVILSRVVKFDGEKSSDEIIGKLYLEDFNYLLNLYTQINNPSQSSFSPESQKGVLTPEL